MGGDISAGGTRFFLSPAQSASGEGGPSLLNPAAPCPHQTNPRGFWVLSGGLQSTAVPVGDGESREGHEKEIGRWQAGHTRRGSSRGPGTSEP